MLFYLLVLFACCLTPSSVDAATTEARSNPIRKVVTLLMNMQKKVRQDGKEAEGLFNKFMCYCDTGGDSLKKQIAAAQVSIPQLKSSIEEAKASHQQLSAELKKHKADREEAKKAIQAADEIRAKEAAAFAKESAELKANIDALSRAIPAISKGITGFLQTPTAGILRQLSVSMEMSNSDRDTLSAFLDIGSSSDDAQQYAPQSGEILGILKQMKDEMQKDLVDLENEENDRLGMHAGLVAAKTKEIGAASRAVEAKTGRIGDIAVSIATLENDLEDTSEALAQDQAFFMNLAKMCTSKKQEWAEYQKTQAAEMVAIAETINTLNDDEALDLLKKTLPKPGLPLTDGNAAAASFLQMRTETRDPIRRKHAIRELKAAGREDRRLALLVLALRGQKAGYGEVIKTIGELVAQLKKEQTGDDNKKEWCLAETDKTEDSIKSLSRDISDTEKVIADSKDAAATITSENEALTNGIQDLDKQVDEATAQRKAENAEYVERLASNIAAKSLLDLAKNRLNKFYNPKLYVSPEKRELSEDERITVNMGGTLAPTAPPGGIAGTGIEAFLQVSAHKSAVVQSPPEADLKYEKRGESSGVIAMLDMLRADLDEQIQEMKAEEKEAQADYEVFMKDASDKRALDSKTLGDKEGAKAELHADIQDNGETAKSHKKELKATTKEEADLHDNCDWLLKNFGLRKKARASEIDSLIKASSVLSGADYS